MNERGPLFDFSSSGESPSLLFRLDREIPDFAPPTARGKILTLAEDPDRDLLLFGTDSGAVGAFDLRAGSERTLLEVPGETPVRNMVLSTDGTALYIELHPDFGKAESRHRQAPRSLIWDYTKIHNSRTT